MREAAVIVLWGARRGDVQYGSRDFWRRNLRIGLPVIVVDRAVFDVGDLFERLPDRDVLRRVDSMEGCSLAFEEVTGLELFAGSR